MRSAYGGWMGEFTNMAESVKMAATKERRTAMEAVKLAGDAQISYLSKEEVERFFAVIPATNVRDRLLFEVIYRHGLRRQEAVLIRREHLRNGRIWITRLKGSRSGEYPIHPATRRLLWVYLAELGDDWHPYLFATRQSDIWPMSPSTVYHLFRRYAAAANLPPERCHPHVLRHSIATHLLTSGWDYADVQDWLGHTSIASTTRYAAVTNPRREEAFRRLLASGEIANNAS